MTEQASKYNIMDWYWIVAGDDTQAWSSARAEFVPVADAGYVAWLATNIAPSRIATLAELSAVFAAQYPAGMLATYSAFKRWERETGGITVSGVPIATDDRSKIMIMGARVAAEANPSFTTVWFGTDGGTYELDSTQIIAISDAVLAHVAECFATSATVQVAIEGETITTHAQVDAAYEAI